MIAVGAGNLLMAALVLALFSFLLTLTVEPEMPYVPSLVKVTLGKVIAWTMIIGALFLASGLGILLVKKWGLLITKGLAVTLLLSGVVDILSRGSGEESAAPYPVYDVVVTLLVTFVYPIVLLLLCNSRKWKDKFLSAPLKQGTSVA